MDPISDRLDLIEARLSDIGMVLGRPAIPLPESLQGAVGQVQRVRQYAPLSLNWGFNWESVFSRDYIAMRMTALDGYLFATWNCPIKWVPDNNWRS